MDFHILKAGKVRSFSRDKSEGRSTGTGGDVPGRWFALDMMELYRRNSRLKAMDVVGGPSSMDHDNAPAQAET